VGRLPFLQKGNTCAPRSIFHVDCR
jgi:hypothetical protein